MENIVLDYATVPQQKEERSFACLIVNVLNAKFLSIDVDHNYLILNLEFVFVRANAKIPLSGLAAFLRLCQITMVKGKVNTTIVLERLITMVAIVTAAGLVTYAQLKSTTLMVIVATMY